MIRGFILAVLLMIAALFVQSYNGPLMAQSPTSTTTVSPTKATTVTPTKEVTPSVQVPSGAPATGRAAL